MANFDDGFRLTPEERAEANALIVESGIQYYWLRPAPEKKVRPPLPPPSARERYLMLDWLYRRGWDDYPDGAV